MDYIEKRVKDCLDDVIDIAFARDPEEKRQEYKDYTLTIINQKQREYNALYRLETQAIEIYNPTEGGESLARSALHELSHRVDHVRRGETDHSKIFYTIYRELIYASLNMGVMVEDDFFNAPKTTEDAPYVLNFVEHYHPRQVDYKAQRKFIDLFFSTTDFDLTIPTVKEPVAEKKPVSIYHVKGVFVEDTTPLKIKNVKPWTIDMPDGMGGYGLSILKVLARYGMLNKHCILKSVMTVNPTPWKKDMLTKTLKALRQAKMIQMFQMNGNADGEGTLVIYCISEKGEQFLAKQNVRADSIKEAREMLKAPSDLNEEIRRAAALRFNLRKETTEEESVYAELLMHECMRKLALNQWHINMLSILKKSIIESFFETFKVGDIFVPSLVTYKPYKAKTGTSAGQKKRLSIFAFPAPSTDDTLEMLAQQIVKTYEFLMEEVNKKYRPGIICVLCENMTHTAWVSWKFNQYRQLRQLDSILYAIDITTNKE